MMAVHHGDEPSFAGRRFAAVFEADTDSSVAGDAEDRDLLIAGNQHLIVFSG